MSLIKATTTRSLVRVSKVLAGATQSTVVVRAAPNLRVRVSLGGFKPITELYTTLQYEFSGGGIPIAAGSYFDVNDIPFPCRLDRWTFTSGDDITGTEIDMLASDFDNYPAFISITGGQPISIDNVNKAQGGTIGWSRIFNPGDILRAQINSNTTAKRIALAIRVVRLSSNG